MNEKESYFPPAALGEVMLGITLGVVTQSNSPNLPVGTYANGMGGWQLWSVAPAESLQALDPHPDIPLELYRSVLDVQGFLVSNYAHLAEPMLQELVPLVLSGNLKYKVDILEGLDTTLEALSRIQSGKNKGVQLIRINPE